MASTTNSFYKPGKALGFNLGKEGNIYAQIISVLANAVSVFLITLSLLAHSDPLFQWVGLATLVVSLASVLYFRAFPLLVYVSRVLVGGFFFVSGLAKANDPGGFSYKLQEYFEENALGFEGLNEYAIYFAILVAVGEIVLGIAAIIGGKMRLTAWTLLILTLFFGWLTYYTSNCLDNQ